MHGAGGGAPKGNQNALKHGLYTAEMIRLRRHIRSISQKARKLLRDLA